MTDINEQIRPTRAEPAAEAASEPAREPLDPELLDLAELLFFAYRDFTREPDKLLDEYGFGRAHHRVLHFVNRHPGLRVADLLEILKITKQSLGRVLKQLVDDGFIAQQAGKTDRRERLLYPTESGRELAERLAAPQLERIAHALAAGGTEGQTEIARFLRRMINEEDRAQVLDLMGSGPPHPNGNGPQK